MINICRASIEENFHNRESVVLFCLTSLSELQLASGCWLMAFVIDVLMDRSTNEHKLHFGQDVKGSQLSQETGSVTLEVVATKKCNNGSSYQTYSLVMYQCQAWGQTGTTSRCCMQPIGGTLAIVCASNGGEIIAGPFCGPGPNVNLLRHFSPGSSSLVEFIAIVYAYRTDLPLSLSLPL